MTGDNTIITSNNFNVDKNGNLTCNNAIMRNVNINGGIVEVKGGENTGSSTGLQLRAVLEGGTQYQYGGIAPQFSIVRNNESTYITSQVGTVRKPTSQTATFTVQGDSTGHVTINSMAGGGNINIVGSSGITYVGNDRIETPTLIQTSLESQKKNFEKVQDNALEILKQIDIYKNNLKNEQDTDKKHIGFVIGDNYNYSKEVTSLDNKGVDNYAFTSLCCKAIQELSQKVEELENKLKEKGEK